MGHPLFFLSLASLDFHIFWIKQYNYLQFLGICTVSLFNFVLFYPQYLRLNLIGYIPPYLYMFVKCIKAILEPKKQGSNP